MLVTHKGQKVDKNWLFYFFKTTPLVSSFVVFFFLLCGTQTHLFLTVSDDHNMILLFFLHLYFLVHFVNVTLFIVSGASCVLARKTSIVCLKKCRITNSTKSRRVAMNHLMMIQGSYNPKMLTGTYDSILLTLYTPTSACIFSILFFIHFLGS